MKNARIFVPVFLSGVTMLIFRIKRIISSKKWRNYFVTFLFFFFLNAKNLGRSDDDKRRKKRGWPNSQIWTNFPGVEFLNALLKRFRLFNRSFRRALKFTLWQPQVFETKYPRIPKS